IHRRWASLKNIWINFRALSSQYRTTDISSIGSLIICLFLKNINRLNISTATTANFWTGKKKSKNSTNENRQESLNKNWPEKRKCPIMRNWNGKQLKMI